MHNFVFIQNAPPPASKKRYQILYLFKTPPSYFQKSGYYTTKQPIKWPNSVFNQNAPSCFQKLRLLPELYPQNDQILYLIVTTPSYFITVV